MTTVAELQAGIATKLLSALSNSVRADSQFTDDLETIASGTTKFQLQVFPQAPSPSADGNDTYIPQLSVAVGVFHYLAPGESEQDYWLTTAQDEFTQILDPDWWTTISGVYHVDDDPSMSDVGRNGNVLSYELTAVVAVNTFS